MPWVRVTKPAAENSARRLSSVPMCLIAIPRFISRRVSWLKCLSITSPCTSPHMVAPTKTPPGNSSSWICLSSFSRSSPIMQCRNQFSMMTLYSLIVSRGLWVMSCLRNWMPLRLFVLSRADSIAVFEIPRPVHSIRSGYHPYRNPAPGSYLTAALQHSCVGDSDASCPYSAVFCQSH